MSESDALPGAESAMLLEFLDYQREALIGRLENLTNEQARSTPTASSLSLLSLIKHSATWERRWFQIIAAGRSFPGEWPDVSNVELGGVGPRLGSPTRTPSRRSSLTIENNPLLQTRS